MFDQVRVTAYRGDTDEPWRLWRIYWLLGRLYDTGVVPGIASLHDHKGTLEVTWRVDATKCQRKKVDAAWRELDPGAVTVHNIPPCQVPW